MHYPREYGLCRPLGELPLKWFYFRFGFVGHQDNGVMSCYATSYLGGQRQGKNWYHKRQVWGSLHGGVARSYCGAKGGERGHNNLVGGFIKTLHYITNVGRYGQRDIGDLGCYHGQDPDNDTNGCVNAGATCYHDHRYMQGQGGAYNGMGRAITRIRVAIICANIGFSMYHRCNGGDNGGHDFGGIWGHYR